MNKRIKFFSVVYEYGENEVYKDIFPGYSVKDIKNHISQSYGGNAIKVIESDYRLPETFDNMTDDDKCYLDRVLARVMDIR